MSVLVADVKVYNYVYNGLRKVAMNDVGNEFYSHTIRAHFRTGDFVAEMKRLVSNWLLLNERAYDLMYNNGKSDDFSTVPFLFWGYTKKPMTAVQLVSFLHCIRYNIDNSEKANLSEQDKKDVELLERFYADLLESIVKSLHEYHEADYSEVTTKCVEPRRALYYYEVRRSNDTKPKGIFQKLWDKAKSLFDSRTMRV